MIMKEGILIYSGPVIDFWAEAMETTENLRNRLPKKTRRHGESYTRGKMEWKPS